MKTIKINRLFHGYASARDYQVQEAMEGMENIRFVLPDGRTMTVPYSKLSKGYWNNEVFKSKQTVGQIYKLVDYDWKSDPKEAQLSIL